VYSQIVPTVTFSRAATGRRRRSSVTLPGRRRKVASRRVRGRAFFDLTLGDVVRHHHPAGVSGSTRSVSSRSIRAPSSMTRIHFEHVSSSSAGTRSPSTAPIRSSTSNAVTYWDARDRPLVDGVDLVTAALDRAELLGRRNESPCSRFRSRAPRFAIDAARRRRRSSNSRAGTLEPEHVVVGTSRRDIGGTLERTPRFGPRRQHVVLLFARTAAVVAVSLHRPVRLGEVDRRATRSVPSAPRSRRLPTRRRRPAPASTGTGSPVGTRRHTPAGCGRDTRHRAPFRPVRRRYRFRYRFVGIAIDIVH